MEWPTSPVVSKAVPRQLHAGGPVARLYCRGETADDCQVPHGIGWSSVLRGYVRSALSKDGMCVTLLEMVQELAARFRLVRATGRALTPTGYSP
jgi:hypothetical protein